MAEEQIQQTQPPKIDTSSLPTVDTQNEVKDRLQGYIDKQQGQLQEAETRRDAVAGTDRQIRTIRDWMNAEENRPETDAERKNRERKERSKKIIAAVSDGLGALSNLFFATRYAPSMYNHDKGQLRATNAVLEQQKAEREQKREQYMQYSLKLGDLENNRARTLRELEAQQEARKLAREKAERDAEAHKWQAALQDDKLREQKGKADRAGALAVTAQAEADNAAALQEAKLETERARGKAQNASATASYASAAAAAQKKNIIYGSFDGKDYLNKRDYDKAVYKAAQEYNKRNHKIERKTKTVERDGKKVEEEYDEVYDPVPISWNVYKTGEPRNRDAVSIAATLEPLLKEERERSTPAAGKGKGYGDKSGKGAGYGN